ncbi:hypothetical protein [Glutamicibacter arilaitensis]|uniref:Hypothetical membrane protein n=2 Tax=Micrococcaceae TaxID=1268 RepID=A0ABP1U6Q6_GLUAR|nr:hypothetical membrane protein [Glutamicibacter arilaitensis Re117]HCH47059.1 hypothetical protein [Glutamicibacter sp.]
MAKPSKMIAQERERMVLFRDAFQRLAGDAATYARGTELLNEVSIAAGAARRAYAVNDGRTFPVQDGIYLVSNADPMSHWASAFDSDSDLTTMKIITSLNLSIGRAQERYEAAKQAERGFVGAVSSILRWPITLRDAAGPGPAQKKAAQSLGIIGQVLVGAVTTALGAAIIQGAILLWHAAFRV